MAVMTITQENFEEQVLQSPVPVLLDFWATWCGPCRMMAPVVEAIAEECPQYRVGKVNVDEQGDLAAQFGIMSIPTLMAFKNGQASGTLVGVQPKARVLELLAR